MSKYSAAMTPPWGAISAWARLRCHCRLASGSCWSEPDRYHETVEKELSSPIAQALLVKA